MSGDSSAARSMNASATAVLPMPGSPVTKTICRSPFFDIRPRHWSSWASASSRPTRTFAGRDAAAPLADAPSVTGAMNRYPRRGHRLDEHGLPGVVAEHRSNGGDVALQHLRFNVSLWPESFEQLIVRHQSTG